MMSRQVGEKGRVPSIEALRTSHHEKEQRAGQITRSKRRRKIHNCARKLGRGGVTGIKDKCTAFLVNRSHTTFRQTRRPRRLEKTNRSIITRFRIDMKRTVSGVDASAQSQLQNRRPVVLEHSVSSQIFGGKKKKKKKD
jgi:hypothetical protein